MIHCIMKKMIPTVFFVTFCLFTFCLFSTALASDITRDIIALRIPFQSGAMATATLPDGEIVELGLVEALPIRTNWPAYTASKWAIPESVAATAVNAVHILVEVEGDRGRIFSIVPKVTIAPAAPRGAFFSIDSPAGTGMFGGLAPLTNSRVSIEGKDGTVRPLTPLAGDALPIEEGESILIETQLGESDTWMVDIENRPGGRVIAWERGPRVVARVVRPLGGVGRFGGTEFQRVGRVRASHMGVIDISTGPRDYAGGFQIMPLNHALTSSELSYVWYATQWMILAPLPGEGPLEGTPPLFAEALVPGTQLDDRLPDVWSTYGRRPLVLGRFGGGRWRTLPTLTGQVNDALATLTHLRIYYPFWNEPGGGSR